MMHPLLLYGLKVCSISGLLYGIYFLMLRNRNHHGWNRFFLVAAPLFSIGIPMIALPLLPPLVSSIPRLVLLPESAPRFAGQNGVPFLLMIYAIVSSAVLFMLMSQIVKICRLRKKYSSRQIREILLIESDAPGTPFSWFRWVFWNKKIDLHSSEGKKILCHELVHVRERHSWDKLMIRLVLIFFWFNPFFWLIGRELSLVHEFLADRQFAGEGDAGAFARMLLATTMPDSKFSFRNPFYFSPIKRRIMMIKNSSKNPGRWGQYLSLLSIAGIFMAFTLERAPEIPAAQKANERLVFLSPGTDTLPEKEIESIHVRKHKDKTKITIHYKDGTSESLTKEEAIKKGISFPPPPPAPGAPKHQDDKMPLPPPAPKPPVNKEGHSNVPPPPPPPAPSEPTADNGIKMPFNTPLFILDGKEISSIEMAELDPGTLASVTVLKDLKAVEKYGPKAIHGVVLMKTKGK